MRNPLRLVFAGVIAVGLIGVAALLFLVDPNKYAGLITSRLSQSLRREVTISKLDFKVFPPTFIASDLKISDDPAFSRTYFLKASTVEVKPALLPLLTGTLDISSIRVLSPSIELIQNSARKWNYTSIGNSGSGNDVPLKLGLFELSLATIGLKQPDAPREVYSNLSATLRDYAEGKPFDLTLAATMPSGKSISASGRVTQSAAITKLDNVALQFASLKGTLNGEISASKLALEASIPSSPLADAAPLFLPAGMNVKGDINATLKAAGTPTQPALSGRIEVKGFEVSGGNIKQPVRTDKLLLALTPDRITLEPASITSGSTRLQLFGVVTSYATIPRLEATLIAPNAQLAELLAIGRAYGASSLEGVNASGVANLQVRAHGVLSAKAPLTYTGTGSLREAHVEAPGLSKPLDVATTTFRFAENSVALEDIKASLGTSNLAGNCRIANFTAPNIDFDFSSDKLNIDEIRTLFKSTSNDKSTGPSRMRASGNLKVGTVQVADLQLTQLTARTAYQDGHLLLNPLNASIYGGRHSGSLEIDLRPAKSVYTLNSKLEQIESSQLLAAVTSLKGIMSGPLNSSLNMSLSPADPVDMARSLNGRISLNLTNGRIASFNLTNELARLGQFLGFSSPDKFTQFASITGDLDIRNGQASTQNLRVTLSNLTAALTGNMNLADQTLDLKLVSLFDKRFSEQVGGNRIGGFMTAALANQNGNLMIPATIRGTFAKPQISPDPAAIAKMKLESFSPANPQQMKDSINSVIDLFKRKKN
jgi:uncharacterized protein involved in outer membrane biogenesis